MSVRLVDASFVLIVMSSHMRLCIIVLDVRVGRGICWLRLRMVVMGRGTGKDQVSRRWRLLVYSRLFMTEDGITGRIG